MSRLALPRRPKTAERDQCLPVGDGLPLWSTLPLDAKFPMVPNKPKGSIVLCTTKLGEPKHKRQLESDFDLSDPWNHVLSNEYLPLHDPHLKELFSSPRMRRHLVRKQFITGDGKVICNLKDFNQYRRYLRRICLMEIARERMMKDEEEKMMREELMNATKTEMKTTDVRLNKVRKRLMDIREQTRKNLELAIQNKADRLKKRLDDIEMTKSVKEVKRQEEERRKQEALYEHRQQLRRRNIAMMRRWQLKQRQHTERMEEQRQQRILDQERKSREMWETRKRIQQQRMEEEARILQKEQKEREKSITNREKMFNEQTERMKAKLDQLKEQARREHEEREKSHATRLSQRLAACEYRVWARHRARRGLRRRRPYKSLWSLEDTIRRFIIPDILPDIVLDDYKSSTSFLRMLNEAIDQTVDIVVQTVEDDDDFEIHERAQEIVNSVLQNVCYGGWPGSGEADLASKSVRFTEEELVISTSENLGVDYSDLKPVSAHQLTPGPSPYDIPSVEKEETKEKTEIKIVENLLTRLLDDLNNGRLSHDHLIRLSTYCIEILGDFDKVKDDGVRGSDSGDTDDSDAADHLVKFTICRILDDIKSGSISSEDLTDLTLSILNASKTSEDDISSEGIENFIDDTICSIVKDGDVREESPVNEYMLEEFVVSTMHTIADDVAHGRLSKSMISNMVGLISREIDLCAPGNDLEGILQRIAEDLDSDKSETLYRVVHTIISSYYSYRESATESLSNLVTDIMSRLYSVIELGEISDTDIDISSLHQVATNLSMASLSTLKMNQLASDISVALNESMVQPQSPLGRNIIEDVVKDVKSKIENADGSALRRIASIVTDSYQHIMQEAQVQESLAEPQDDIDSSLQRVSQFVVKVLKMVKKYLDEGEFSQDDIKEMSCILFEMSSDLIAMPTPFNQAESALNQYINTLLTEVENGNIAPDELKQLGNDLIAFGQRIVTSSLSRSTSQTISSRPSLTSTAVAEDFVTHMISSMEADLSRGVMSSESLKELAVCILKPTISRENASVHKPEEGLVSPVKHPSPCESQLADMVVNCTIESVLKDLEEGIIPPVTICSIGTSVTAHLSQEDQEFKPVISKIIHSLKEDNIDRQQAQRIFSIILDHYKVYKDTVKDTRKFFEKRSSAASSSLHAESFISEALHNIERDLERDKDSDSVLAESLIKETLFKIKRDIQSGKISDDDLSSLLEGSDKSAYYSSAERTSKEIINFVLTILHESLVSIGTGEMPTEALMEFLTMVDENLFRSKQDYTLNEISGNLRHVIHNIKTKGNDSVFLRNIITTFAGKEARLRCGQSVDTWKPLQALQSILQTVEPNVLTNFVRITLHSVLRDVTLKKKPKGERNLQEVGVPDYLLQSTSSVVANNVVRNLMSKIESILISGGSLRPDLDFSALRIRSSSEEAFKAGGVWEAQLTSASSKHLGDMILQTLNNIVSNLRLERSISQMGIDGKDEIRRRSSSEIVDDFILEKLQEIIESMQDSFLFDFKEPRAEPSPTDVEVVDKKSSLLPMTDKEATEFVTTVLRDVVKELAEDASESKGTAEKQTSTLSLEAENIVIGALQNIIDQFCFSKTGDSSEPDDVEIKIYVLNVLEDIRRSISGSGTEDENVKTAVTKIFKDSSKDSNAAESESRDFLESTLDFIIENIKGDKLKASDIYNSAVVSSSDSDDIFDDNLDIESESNLGRPSLSLQKMSEMTSKMLKLHDDLQKVPETIYEQSVTQEQEQSLESAVRSITDVSQDIVTEAIKQTITNLTEGKVSDHGTLALASALGCGNTVNISQESAIGPEDHVVTEYITDMLQNVLDKLNKVGVHPDLIEHVTDRLVKSKSDITEQYKGDGDSCSSLSSTTSDILADAVKNLIGTIRKQLSDEQQNRPSDWEMSIRKSSRPSTPKKVTSAHATVSGTSESSNTVSETSSKGNINPNAVIKSKPNNDVRIGKPDSKSGVIPFKNNQTCRKDPRITKPKNVPLPPSGARRNSLDIISPKVKIESDVRSTNRISKLKTDRVDSTNRNTPHVNKTATNKEILPTRIKSGTGQKYQPKCTLTSSHGKQGEEQDQSKCKTYIKSANTTEKKSKPSTPITLKSERKSENVLNTQKTSGIKTVVSPVSNNKTLVPPSGKNKTRSSSVQEQTGSKKLITSKVENRRSISTLGGTKPTAFSDQSKKSVKRNRKKSAKLEHEEKISEIPRKNNGERRSANLLQISSLCGSHKSTVKIRSVNEEND